MEFAQEKAVSRPATVSSATTRRYSNDGGGGGLANTSRNGDRKQSFNLTSSTTADDISDESLAIEDTSNNMKEYGEWASVIFRIADKNRNGCLSINEMSSMLRGSAHQGFVEWLLFHRNEMFRIEDTDMSGTLEINELAQALKHFHKHVKTGESKPLADETEISFVARMMIENMYRSLETNKTPSFKALFESVDLSENNVLEFSEVEHMIRKVLKISPKKLSHHSIKIFFHTIDRDNDMKISRDEFVKFMMHMSMNVSKAFVSFPPPNNTGFESFFASQDGGDGMGSEFAPASTKPYWLIPLTHEEKVKYTHDWHTIGGFTSISQRGAMLKPREENKTLPSYPPLPDIHTTLAKQITFQVEMKEKRENTAWDLSGPRYQCTKKVLENYHAARVIGGKDGFYCETRFHGLRAKHKPPMLLKGQPISSDEARFIQQRNNSSSIAEPLFMDILSKDTNVYDRLCNVTTTSRLHNKIAFAEDRARTADFNGKRKPSSKNRYRPL